jgi:hypothetical protein
VKRADAEDHKVDNATAVRNSVDQVADPAAEKQRNGDQERNPDQIHIAEKGNAQGDDEQRRSDAERNAYGVGQVRS